MPASSVRLTVSTRALAPATIHLHEHGVAGVVVANTVRISVWRCRVHVRLVAGECWHGTCPLCGRTVTAFDYTYEEAEANVMQHVRTVHSDEVVQHGRG
jgi:hypothetical protein